MKMAIQKITINSVIGTFTSKQGKTWTKYDTDKGELCFSSKLKLDVGKEYDVEINEYGYGKVNFPAQKEFPKQETQLKRESPIQEVNRIRDNDKKYDSLTYALCLIAATTAGKGKDETYQIADEMYAKSLEKTV